MGERIVVCSIHIEGPALSWDGDSIPILLGSIFGILALFCISYVYILLPPPMLCTFTYGVRSV